MTRRREALPHWQKTALQLPQLLMADAGEVC